MNRERYNDPTADIAISNVIRIEKMKKQDGGSIGKKSKRKERESPRTV